MLCPFRYPKNDSISSFCFLIVFDLRLTLSGFSIALNIFIVVRLHHV